MVVRGAQLNAQPAFPNLGVLHLIRANSVCGLPAEYCEFGPDFNRCKPWLIEHCPEIYPSLIKKEGEEGEEKGMSPPALVEDSRYSWL